MSKRVLTSFLESAHPYTHSEVPWRLEKHPSVYGRLIDYLSGGGMRAFGRSIRQEEVRLRQRRFLTVAAVLTAIWLGFWLF